MSTYALTAMGPPRRGGGATLSRALRRGAGPAQGVLEERHQDRLGALAVPGVAGQEGDVAAQGQRVAHLLEGVVGGVGEPVAGHQERHAAVLEVVDGGEAL